MYHVATVDVYGELSHETIPGNADVVKTNAKTTSPQSSEKHQPAAEYSNRKYPLDEDTNANDSFSVHAYRYLSLSLITYTYLRVSVRVENVIAIPEQEVYDCKLSD
jgi:hypothetical protein